MAVSGRSRLYSWSQQSVCRALNLGNAAKLLKIAPKTPGRQESRTRQAKEIADGL
jgi:hypothetical protein